MVGSPFLVCAVGVRVNASRPRTCEQILPCSSLRRRLGLSADTCFANRLLSTAFVHVLRRKQTRYTRVLQWLEQRRRSGRGARKGDAPQLAALARRANAVYEGYKF